MFDRIANSFALARSSWQVLRTDKQLIVFPIVSGVACFFVLLSFALPFIVHPQWLDLLQNHGADGRQPPPVWAYVVTFAYYLCNYFVIIFCNAALISCALMRFHGQTPTVGDGFRAASLRLPQILAWALISATVGLLLKAIENAHEKAGAIISSLLGTAWTVITYFVVPVLVVEKVGPFQAVQRSMAVLRKTWGESLVGHFGIGFFMFLLSIPGLVLIVLGIVLLQTMMAIGIALLVAGVLELVLTAAVSAALNGIFLAALYQYSSFGEVPQGFDDYTMKNAFARK
jgi:hypothetical protein